MSRAAGRCRRQPASFRRAPRARRTCGNGVPRRCPTIAFSPGAWSQSCQRGNMVDVAEGLLFGDRAWFHDTRTPARRMAVSAHADDGIIVVSFWQGDTCTATFRLPLADGARLIAAVAS